jgi:glycerophosphoryl diester phosphodiesterase
VTRIGNTNPLARLSGAVKGWLDGESATAVAGAKRPWVIAHRGAAREAPENTVEAFARAVELGADAIETDVCVTADGVYVLWHDADPDGRIALARQTVVGGSKKYGLRMADLLSRARRRVCELTLAELRREYGYVRKNADGSDGERVPIALLTDLFDWAESEPRLAHAFLDVKIRPPEVGEALRLLETVEARVRGRRSGPHVHYLSTHREVLDALARRVAEKPPPERLEVTADFELPGVLENVRRLRLRDVSMGCGARLWPDFRRELAEVAAARAAGELDSLVAWTLNDPRELETALELGVDGIMTDDPAGLARRVAQP